MGNTILILLLCARFTKVMQYVKIIWDPDMNNRSSGIRSYARVREKVGYKIIQFLGFKKRSNDEFLNREKYAGSMLRVSGLDAQYMY